MFPRKKRTPNRRPVASHDPERKRLETALSTMEPSPRKKRTSPNFVRGVQKLWRQWVQRRALERALDTMEASPAVTPYLTRPELPPSQELVRVEHRSLRGKGPVWVGTLIRHGQRVCTFLLTSHQKRLIDRGERIRIEPSQIKAAAALSTSVRSR